MVSSRRSSDVRVRLQRATVKSEAKIEAMQEESDQDPDISNKSRLIY